MAAGRLVPLPSRDAASMMSGLVPIDPKASFRRLIGARKGRFLTFFSSTDLTSGPLCSLSPVEVSTRMQTSDLIRTNFYIKTAAEENGSVIALRWFYAPGTTEQQRVSVKLTLKEKQLISLNKYHIIRPFTVGVFPSSFKLFLSSHL